MNPFFFVIFFLRLSLATAADFTQVFQWKELDFKWPSEASRAQALKAGTFKPENIEPRYMAVFGKRIFLSLENNKGIPATLVYLPTSSESSASPKLTPLPALNMHDNGNCNQIQAASGLEIDSFKRLWVLDSGSNKCNAKIWTINLSSYDHTKIIHKFSFQKSLQNLVIDEANNETWAYISQENQKNIVVYSLKQNQSWTVDTRGIHVFSIALSPKEEQLYVSQYNSTELYSISVAALRNGNRTVNPKLIGKWRARPYRMLMDNRGTMYAAFLGEHYIQSWNTCQPFQEQRFLDVGKLVTEWPFTFALDASGIFWTTELNKTATITPRYRLLRAAAVGAEPERSCLSAEESSTTKVKQYRLLNTILICSNLFSVVLLGLIILWLILRQTRNNCLPQNTNETLEMSAVYFVEQDEHLRSAATTSVPDENIDVDTAIAEEGLYEEVRYDQVGVSLRAPSLYERPICLSPRSARRVRPMPVRPRTFETFGEAPPAPIDVGSAQPEHLYDDVAPETSSTPSYESAQYLPILPYAP